jgi:hypothetical protein
VFYELRFYHAAPDTIDDLAHRVGVVLQPYFSRHRFGRILGQWRSVDRLQAPVFVWMLA